MKLKIKKLTELAAVPSYAKEGDACVDLTATSIDLSNPNYIEYGTGLAIELPENHVALIYPRSSISNTDLSLANSVGVIDSSYRGEIKFRFKSLSEDYHPTFYRVGDRIGQMMVIPYPKMEFEVVDTLSETERGQGGYGSSGR